MRNKFTKIVFSLLGLGLICSITPKTQYATLAESVTTNDNGSSSSISDQRRELITADEVRRIDENKMIIIAHNKPVVFDERNNWYLQDKYLKKVPGSK